MPYLTPENKKKVEYKFESSLSPEIFGAKLENSGELNYSITQIIRGYFKSNGGRYQQINDVIGSLESAKAEFQRRIVSFYENSKIESNGDVY